MLYVLTLLCFALHCVLASITAPSEQKDAKLIESSINQIYDDYIDIKSSLTLYVHSDPNQTFINFYFPNAVYSEKRTVYKFKHYKKFDTFIIAINENTYKGVVDYIRKLDTWNPRGRFLIVFNGNLENLFAYIAIYHIYNVLVLKSDGENLEFYTYFPYIYENYNTPNLDVVKLGNYNDLHKINLFPDKLPMLWRNSSAFISFMPLYPYVECAPCGTGIEVVLVRMLSEKLGFNVTYDSMQYSNWGVKRPDGSYEGAIEALRTRRADFVIGYFHLRELDHLIDFDYTFSHIEDDLAWALPAPKPLSHWANLVNIFEVSSWIFIFLTLSISGLCWWFIGKLTEQGYYKSGYVFELPFKLLLLISMPFNPRKLPGKLMYVSTWTFCFIITTVWNSYLIFYLTHETYEHQIANTQELVGSNLLLGIHPELAELYRASGTPTGLTIYNRFYRCDASYTCLDRVGFKRDMASITTHRIFKYILPEKYQNAKGQNIIELLREAVVKDYGVFYFQKGHPLLDRLNIMLIRLRGAGYVVYLDEHTDFRNALIHKSALFATALFETSTLTLKQMEGPFYLFMFGLVIAFAWFIGEIVHFYSKHGLYFQLDAFLIHRDFKAHI